MANTISFTSKAARSQEPHVIYLQEFKNQALHPDFQIQLVLRQKQLEVKKHMLYLQEFKNQAFHKNGKYNQFYIKSS